MMKTALISLTLVLMVIYPPNSIMAKLQEKPATLPSASVNYQMIKADVLSYEFFKTAEKTRTVFYSIYLARKVVSTWQSGYQKQNNH